MKLIDLSFASSKHGLRTKFLIFFILFITASCATYRVDLQPSEFTIIGTADLQGSLEPTGMQSGLADNASLPDIKKKDKNIVGGISRIATLIKGIKSEKQGTVAVVSTGDDLMKRYFHTYKGKAIFKLLSLAGYEIYAFGNHEFDKGPKILSEALENTDFSVFVLI